MGGRGAPLRPAVFGVGGAEGPPRPPRRTEPPRGAGMGGGGSSGGGGSGTSSPAPPSSLLPPRLQNKPSPKWCRGEGGSGRKGKRWRLGLGAAGTGEGGAGHGGTRDTRGRGTRGDAGAGCGTRGWSRWVLPMGWGQRWRCPPGSGAVGNVPVGPPWWQTMSPPGTLRPPPNGTRCGLAGPREKQGPVDFGGWGVPSLAGHRVMTSGLWGTRRRGCGCRWRLRFDWQEQILGEPAVNRVLERPCLGRAPAPEPTAGIVCPGGAQRLSSIRQRPEQGIVVGPNRVTAATASPGCRALPWPEGPAMLSRDAVTGRPASAAVRHL